MTKDLKELKETLLKRYHKEFDALIENIQTIESELDILKDHVARLELLDKLIQKLQEPDNRVMLA